MKRDSQRWKSKKRVPISALRGLLLDALVIMDALVIALGEMGMKGTFSRVRAAFLLGGEKKINKWIYICQQRCKMGWWTRSRRGIVGGRSCAHLESPHLQVLARGRAGVHAAQLSQGTRRTVWSACLDASGLQTAPEAFCLEQAMHRWP